MSKDNKKETPKKNIEISDVELRIEKNFTDKYTNANYKIGEIVSFEKSRAEEILRDPRQVASRV